MYTTQFHNLLCGRETKQRILNYFIKILIDIVTMFSSNRVVF